jgi:hypothetical protein
MSKSTPALLAAIAGYRGEHSGSKEHESIIEQLSRIEGEVKGGKAVPQDSPGRKEATAAAQREMGAERGHSGGGGQRDSNDPAPAAAHGETPPNPAPSNGAPEDKLTGAASVPSRGNAVSAKGAPSWPSGANTIRGLAAERALSDGNKDSNLPGSAPPNSARVGDVSPPAKEPTDKNTKPGSEATPPFAKESLAGDGWGRARAGAKKLLKSAK